MTLPQQLIHNLQTYNKQLQPQTLTQILSLQPPQSPHSPHSPNLLQQLESHLTTTFQSLILTQRTTDLCSLLNLVWKSLQNKYISKDILIRLLDSILECVGVEDLKLVLAVVRERLDELGELELVISYQFLRIINVLLRRISRVTDAEVRGELHLTITKIVNFCHESGFEYRGAGGRDGGDRVEIEEGVLEGFKDSRIGVEFYENFWELQRYFMDVNQLVRVGDGQGSGVATPAKQQIKDPKLLSIRLKKIQHTLTETITYFKITPPTDHKTSLSIPPKYTKLPNLLPLQLQDSYFRLLILTQSLVFCSSLKYFPAKHQLEMSAQSKQTLKRIETDVRAYIQVLEGLRGDFEGVLGRVEGLVRSEGFWVGLKDNWRERKKSFFRRGNVEGEVKRVNSMTENAGEATAAGTAGAATTAQLGASGSLNQPQTQPLKKTPTVPQTTLKYRKQISNRLQIPTTPMQTFLQHTESPTLKKAPISPSFAYYYSQAKTCLQTFDQQQQCQTEFETRSEYNLFEWKAFRSLQRQRITPNTDIDRNSKLSQYRLLEFVGRKMEVFESGRKRVKLSEDQREG